MRVLPQVQREPSSPNQPIRWHATKPRFPRSSRGSITSTNGRRVERERNTGGRATRPRSSLQVPAASRVPRCRPQGSTGRRETWPMNSQASTRARGTRGRARHPRHLHRMPSHGPRSRRHLQTWPLRLGHTSRRRRTCPSTPTSRPPSHHRSRHTVVPTRTSLDLPTHLETMAETMAAIPVGLATTTGRLGVARAASPSWVSSSLVWRPSLVGPSCSRPSTRRSPSRR